MQNVSNAYPNSGAAAAQIAYQHVYSRTVAPLLIVLVASLCFAVGYYWLLTGFWGTTIGKRILGTWVVTAKGWSEVGMGAALIRAIVFVVGGEIAFPLFFLIDSLWLLRGSQRQCLHDKAARTIVVKGAALGR